MIFTLILIQIYLTLMSLKNIQSFKTIYKLLKENEKLFSKLKTNPNDNQTKLIIAHLNIPLAFKYIYP